MLYLAINFNFNPHFIYSLRHYVPANIYLPIRQLYDPHRREIYEAIQREKGEKLKGERRLDPCLRLAGTGGWMHRWAEASRFILIIGQISRLRCAPLEMTPERITANGGLRSK